MRIIRLLSVVFCVVTAVHEFGFTLVKNDNTLKTAIIEKVMQIENRVFDIIDMFALDRHRER